MFKPVIVIPCFNHSDAFVDVAKRIAEHKIPVIVVDDGSDKFQAKKLQKICTDYNFIYIRNNKNSGKGAAIKTGFAYADKHGFTNAIQIDADGQHNIDDIKKFLDIAKKHPDALIMGQPIYNSDAPKSRLIGRKITNFWVAIETLNRHLPDAMCGFRVYPIRATNKILASLRFFRMGFDIEVFVKLYRDGVKIISVETPVIYPKSGTSHFRVWRDNFYISLMHTYLFFGLPWWLVKQAGKKMKNLFLLSAIFCTPVFAEQITQMPDGIKNFTDNLDTVYASYTQTKTIPESVKTFRAYGTVKFVKGTGFIWKQLGPKEFEFISTLDSYCANNEKQALAALPYFSQIQSMINDMLNGDMSTFLVAFNADYNENQKNKTWTMVATPKLSSIGDFLQSMTFSGNATDLNQMIIKYKNGTKITIDFKRIDAVLDDEIKC